MTFVKTHGRSFTREYTAWREAKARCTNKNHRVYKDYGGRGIKLCKRWIKFENFFEDMGAAGVGMTLDRVDNSGPYSKENCRWATMREQCNNRRGNKIITYKGQSDTMANWARKAKIPYRVLKERLGKKNNWTVERALTEPKMGAR